MFIQEVDLKFIQDKDCAAASAKKTDKGVCRLAYDDEDLILIEMKTHFTYVKERDSSETEGEISSQLESKINYQEI